MSDAPNEKAPDAGAASGASNDVAGIASEQDDVNIAQGGEDDNSWTTERFLREIAPNGPWCLAAIDKTKSKVRIEVRTFGPDSAAECVAWIARWNGVRNLYFTINPVLRALTKKPERTDIAALAVLHVDIDPRPAEERAGRIREERERALHLLTDGLPKGVPSPNVIVDSGGGYQGIWKLREPVPIDGDLARAEDAKRYNQALEQLFGGDSCHNIDRLMRLPGTWNLPTPAKLDKGREKAMARVVRCDLSHACSLGEMPPPVLAEDERQHAPASKIAPRPLGDLSELDQWGVPDNVKRMALEGTDDPANKPHVKGQRSERVFRFVCEMVRREVPDEVIAGVLTDARFAISESVLELGSRAQRYTERQIERVKEAVSDFDTNENGKILATQANIRRAVARLGIALSYDQFANRLLIDGREMQDNEVERLYLRIEQCYRFRPSQDYFWMVVKDAARRNAFHPVRDYLDALAWDGVARLDGWLTTYGGAEDTAYTRAVGTIVMVAAVRRVRAPGCTFQEMLVLESPQGKNKSTALKTLAVNAEWFTDDVPLGVESRIVVEKTEGKWIVEAAELSGMRKAQVETLKAFISRSKEQGVRRVYGRLAADVPRQFVLAGTTNNDRYLQDQTGNRRFWPVGVEVFDIAALERDRDQLWAEAAAREAAGESIRLDPRLYGAAAAEQAERMVEDPWEDRLRDALGEGNGRVLAAQIWREVGVEVARRTQGDNARLGAIMKRLGFVRTELRYGKRTGKGYRRGGGLGHCWLLGDPGTRDDERGTPEPDQDEIPF